MLRHAALALALFTAALAPGVALAECAPEGMNRQSLQTLRTLGFAVPDAADRAKLAKGLVECLGDPDPSLRDGIAYEGLTHWMRAGQIDSDTLRTLTARLYAIVEGGEGEGFARPFAALVLSEVARTNRIAPWMTPVERATMVEKASAYLETVEDYRGFDDREGWRHGVAHGADWLMQLALDPALERAHAERMLRALAVQIVPGSAHPYVFGEPGRLVRPVVAIARQGLYTGEEWRAWMLRLPPRIGEAEHAYADSDWLTRRHDLLAFFTSLYLEADQSSEPAVQALKPALVAALKTVP